MVPDTSSWPLFFLCGLLDGLIHQLSKKPFTIFCYHGSTTPVKQTDKYALRVPCCMLCCFSERTLFHIENDLSTSHEMWGMANVCFQVISTSYIHLLWTTKSTTFAHTKHHVAHKNWG